MAEEILVETNESETESAALRVYEVGYHIKPDTKEEELDGIVAGIRSIIEKSGGSSFIAEGAPALTRLAYAIDVREGEKHVEYDRGYFGWVKFEAKVEVAAALEEALKRSKDYIRAIVFQTVREDTRAKMKAPQLREVKRTDAIHTHTAPLRAEESKGPVSEEQLEKALSEITSEA
jgi:ribosomal protein S6